MNELIHLQRIRSILRKSLTKKHELIELMDLLNVPATVDWQMDFNESKPYQILNLGNGIIGGTHWVAVDNKNRRYFDSFGLPPPDPIPKDYEWQPIQIQDINYGHCGQYATLFLYYSQKGELDKFYNMFSQKNSIYGDLK